MNCPNPTCPSQFSNEQDVCDHLSQPGTTCWEWTTAFLDIMVQGIGRNNDGGDNDEDEDEDEYYPEGTLLLM